MNSLPPQQALQIIRAFGFFSHLANIAEDQHQLRDIRAREERAVEPVEGSIAHALARAEAAGIAREQVAEFFASGLVVPVLTAHPTEVRRKSTIDREMEIADLLAERDRGALTAAEMSANELSLRRAVLTLWQTNLLRKTRLRVIDEIANGLSFYDSTFLSDLPGLYADLEEQLGDHGAACRVGCHRFCAWAAGSAVTATATRLSPRRYYARHSQVQSSRALRHYLDELHLLGGELSLDSRLVGVSPSLEALPQKSPDRSPAREDEPYRRSITGIYARLAGDGARRSTMSPPRNTRSATAPPYAGSGELLADLSVIDGLAGRQRLRDPDQRAAQAFAPGGRRIRISSRGTRFAAEFRCPRACDRRDARPRRSRASITRGYAEPERIRLLLANCNCPPAGLGLSRLFERDRE